MSKPIQRHSRQRQVILEELRMQTTHPTATELHQLAKQRLPNLSLGTVYRNLELLTRTGLIRRLDTRGGEARYDGDCTHHFHVRCLRCGRVNDAHGLSAAPVKEQVQTLDGYRILGYRLEFEGICPTCQKRPTRQR
ncbi:MAG: transcriptional repressor [Phycisphaerales bacterium]|nr:MAG: transcriptional repressor [Phycisphaerales bacterium]